MKLQYLRACSLLLAAVMVFNLLPHEAIASGLQTAETSGGTDVVTSAMEEVTDVEPASIMAEITENRTEFSKEFKLSNGQNLAVVYPEAVHYEDNGQWKDIDNTLTATGTVNSGTYRNTQGTWQVTFPQQLRGDNWVSVTEKGYTVSFGMAGELRAIVAEKAEAESSAVMRQSAMEQTVLTVSQMQTSVAQIAQKESASLIGSIEYPEVVPETLSSRLTYSNVYANTDITYDLSSGRLKESVVLNSYNAAVRGYRYVLETGGLIPVLNEDNSIDLIAPDSKEIIMSMPAPYMIDDAGVTNTDVGVSLVASGDSYILTYTMPMAWVAEADRAWPVVLDPVVVGSSQRLNILDQFVAESYYENNNHGAMYTGYYGPFGRMRSYLRYVDLPDLTYADLIVNANLSLMCFSGNSAATIVEAHRVNALWQSQTITWGAQPASSTTVEDFVQISTTGRHDWDITDAVRKWYAGSNYGVMLKSPDSIENGSTDNWKKFYTVDYDIYDSNTWPLLYITFRNTSGLEDYWDYTTSSAGRAGTGYVNNFSGNLTWVHSDLGFGGNRMPVTISHVYNSNDCSTNQFGLGYGWRTNFNQTVQLWEEDSTYYVWEDGDGTKHYFYYESANTYKDEDGLNLTLTVSGSNKIITDKFGNTSHFDSSGRLWKLENNQQQKSNIEIIYLDSTSKLISRIDDGIDRKYSFVYSNNLLTGINYFSNTGQWIAYIEFYYSSGRLTSIAYEDGESSTFTYDSANCLTSAVDIDGYTLLYTYSSTDPRRVVGISECDGDVNGGSQTITYAPNQTTIKDHNENVQILQFNNWGNLVAVQDDQGRAQYIEYNRNSYNHDNTKANQLRLSSKLQNTVSNLFANSSFEDNSSSRMWSPNSTTITRTHSTEAAYLGAKSMKLVASTTSTRYGAYSPQFSVAPSETVTFSAYIKTVDASVGIALERNTNYKIFDGTLVAEGQDWNRYQISYTNTSSTTELFRGYFFVQDPGTVYIDCVQAEYTVSANRYNIIENGDFRFGAYNWIMSNYCDSNETSVTLGASAAPQLDTTAFQIVGDPSHKLRIRQEVPVSGVAGDVYVLAGWAKGDGIPLRDRADGNHRTFTVRGTFMYTDGTTGEFNFDFNPDISGDYWQSSAGMMVAEKAYSGIKIQVLFDFAANTVYFDGIQLFKEMFGTSYTYDANGNIKSVIDLQKQTTTYEYDTNNNLTEIIRDDNTEMTYTYDNRHNVKTATASSGEVYQFEYDDYGNNTKVKITRDGYTIQSTAEYTDDFNRLQSTTDALGNTTTYDYDENTNVLNWVQYPNDTPSTRTVYGYDALYHLTDIQQNVSNISDAIMASYSYDYDLLTRLSTASTSYTFTYGAFSQISRIKAGNYTLAEYTYTDDANRYLSEVLYGNWHSVLYDYDNFGRLIQEVFKDDLGSVTGTTTYQYNDLNEVVAVIDTTSGITTTYQRNLAGRLVGYEENSEDYFHKVAYGYDTKNNLTQLSDTILGTTYTSEYTYDDSNRVSKVTDGLVEKTYTYDDFSRPDEMITTHGDSEVLTQTDTYVTAYIEGVGNVTTGQVHTRSYTAAGYNKTFTYTYDDNGNILSVSDGTYTTSYEYDNANQLIRENNQAGGFTHVWTYDDAGNILCRDEYSYSTGTLDYPDTTFDYYYSTSGWGDLLTEDDEKCYDYDGMGNRSNDDDWEYEWQKGRQLGSLFGGDEYWHFSYNADGMRIGRIDSESGTEYTYYYNGSLLRMMTVDGNKLYFVYDAAGSPVQLAYTPAGSTTTSYYYFVTNLQGDVIAILNSSGAVVVEYTYDAWGKLLSITGSMVTTLGRQNPLRYRGYVYDQETSLYYLQSRYYDPEIGRFINADALVSTGQGLLGNNMFAYCNNNPTTYADPSGTLCVNAFLGDYRTQDILTTGGGGGGTGYAVGAASSGAKALRALENSVNTTSEAVAYSRLKAYGFAVYNGVPVFMVDLGDDGRGFSFGIIVLDDSYSYNEKGINTLRHEYGHRQHTNMIGLTNYFYTTAIPSLMFAGLSNAKMLGMDYYSLPWEHIADMLGNVNRGGYEPWAGSGARTFMVYTLIYSVLAGGRR